MAEQVLTPAETARAAVRTELDRIDTAHARLRALNTDIVGNTFRIEVAERLETQHRTNRGLSYRILGEIADPTDGPDQPTSTATLDLLWQKLRIPRAELRRRIRIAARIRPRRNLTGPPRPPELPHLATAIEEGHLGDDHLKTITTTLDHLPTTVTPADRDRAEHTLVHHGREHDADFVRIAGQRIADHLNPDGTYTDHDRARRRTLNLGRQGPDGMSTLTGCLDPETRAYLETALAAVRPGHRQPDGLDTTGPDLRSNGQRNHDALKLTLRAGIASGELGTHRGVPVTVIATTTLAELNQALHATTNPAIPMPGPATTGGGSRLPLRDLITMAADSIHYLAVFDDHSNRPLYLGRSKRLATLDHRIICHARDRGCTRPGCPAPGYHCEVHHTPDWNNGGQTNPDQLHFACGCDHTTTTQGQLHTQVTDQGRLAWTDGTTPPAINHLHHPEELLDKPPDNDEEEDP
ncbi:HNH endonuclease signature motif containing protein [[Mycobacterium] kokjensenii]|uniref:HNH endonuclease signature motif containing protein n=1 Tax=[Mycobacterium] kokjensenii TaxID=3064287 RepID=A0ABM9LCA9_9MYCO|nr:HNH endonuclease signature motif containing protein [Mycolicibacter sp. MU0083]CAJ1496597.1 HNH endonuclease signature motif containing protein [Mycolicibacter sp. MU0083]